jgi:quaternary ammonium compound-resistance protein SugE
VKTSKRAWFYLIAAALMEACWFYSIQWMQKLSWPGRFPWIEGPMEGWLGLLGYAGFGIANALFFLKAAKSIPASIAFGVWTGSALFAMVLIDHFFGIQPLDVLRSLCLLFIFTGVLGLKKES